jgi:single-stranded-DNA-specific exonuclease
VIVFAPDRDGNIKGSGRSVAGTHLRDALAAVATRAARPDRHQFGGHAMAAGLTFGMSSASKPSTEPSTPKLRQLAERRRLCRAALLSDGELATRRSFPWRPPKLLREAGPWGQGFPEPLFDGTFEVSIASASCGIGKTLKLWLRPPGTPAWPWKRSPFRRAAGLQSPDTAPGTRIAYRLDVNRVARRAPAATVASSTWKPT